MVNKSQYYAEQNGLDPIECAPINSGNGPELIGPYADAILAIQDDDPDFLEWLSQKERELMVLTPWQFRKAINATGKRAIVEAALSSMSEDEQDGWHVASSFERLNPLVVKLAQEILGFTNNQLDNFFRNATL